MIRSRIFNVANTCMFFNAFRENKNSGEKVLIYSILSDKAQNAVLQGSEKLST